MKKILFLFLMLFGMSNVYALEYSDYSDFSEYTDQYIQGDDLTDVRTERRYKYYKYEKESGGYGENDLLKYPYFDKDDYIYTEYSKATMDKPEIKEGRVIETVDGYHYRKVKDINYIKLESQMFSSMIGDIEVLYKDEKIDYELQFNKATSDFKMKSGGYIKLKFDDNIDIRYISVSFKIMEVNGAYASIRVGCGYDEEEFSYSVYNKKLNDFVSWKGIDIPGYANSYEDYYTEDISVIGRACNHVGNVTLYKYKDILYHYYNLIKVYYDDYLSAPLEDYIYKDDLLYKDFYSFRTRTIIPTIVDSAIINNDSIIDEVKSDKSYLQSSMNPILDKTDSVYKVPQKSIYYPIDINKIENLKEVDTFKILYPFFILIIFLVILILVLSKLYKKKKECVTV